MFTGFLSSPLSRMMAIDHIGSPGATIVAKSVRFGLLRTGVESTGPLAALRPCRASGCDRCAGAAEDIATQDVLDVLAAIGLGAQAAAGARRLACGPSPESSVAVSTLAAARPETTRTAQSTAA